MSELTYLRRAGAREYVSNTVALGLCVLSILLQKLSARCYPWGHPYRVFIEGESASRWERMKRVTRKERGR